MSSKQTLIAISAAIALGSVGAASVAQAGDQGEDRGGFVMPGSTPPTLPVLIVADGALQEDPIPAASIALRYEYRRELVRLGVFSREDDLYARDRGRGFDRSYAPDPDRRR